MILGCVSFFICVLIYKLWNWVKCILGLTAEYEVSSGGGTGVFPANAKCIVTSI